LPASPHPSAYVDTKEYYRLVREARRRDPDAREATAVDAEILAMVERTPDTVAMHRAFMEGGLAFRLMRAIAVDGARLMARLYDELYETPMAAAWRDRADALARSRDYAAFGAASREADAVEAALRPREGRTQQLVQTCVENTIVVDASPVGAGLDDAPRATLAASLEELRLLFPDRRFPEVLKIPRFRQRLAFDDAGLERVVAVFEKVNRERLGGKF